MSLFLKHLFRSIVKKPLQPIILILTLALSVSICVFSFSMDVILGEELETAQREKFGTADISISLNSTSRTRFVFSENAERALDGRGRAVGSFELPMFFGDEKRTVFGVAVDFYDVSEIFDIKFLEYGTVTPSSAVSAAFVSSEFAKEQSLSLGERLTLEIAGQKKEYTVSGISKNTFFGSCDVMVDITGVMRILAANNLILSSMGDSFKPSSTIYVDINDGESVTECIAALKAEDMFSDKEIKDVTEYVKQQANNDTIRLSLSFAIALAALLCAAVSFSCFYILSLGRAEENAVFYAAGARRRLLVLAEYLEVLLYWIVGGAFGLLLASPLISGFMRIVKFSYATPVVDTVGAIKGTGCILAVSLLTVTILDLSDRLMKKKTVAKKNEALMALLFSIAFAVVSVLTHILPVKLRMASLVLMIALMILAAFFAVPVLIRGLMKLINGWAEKNARQKNYSLLYAVKNVFSVKILHNTALLVVISVSTMLSLGMVIVGGWGSVEYSRLALNGDYAILNSTSSCYEKVLGSESVDSVHSVYVGTMSENNVSFFNAFSADDIKVFWDELNVDRLPRDDQAVLSEVLAAMLELKVGDHFSPEILGRSITLEVAEITDSTFGYVLFDSEYFGIPQNTLILEAKDGYSNAEVLEEVTGEIALEMASVIPLDEIFGEKTKNVSVFLESGKLLLIVLAIFITVGMLDNLFESYRARSEDCGLFMLSGMKKSQIAKMKFFEFLITFTFGLILGILLMLVLSSAIDSMMWGYGYSPIGGMRAYLGL